LQNTKTDDTTITGTKMQELSPGASGSGTGAQPATVAPKAVSHPSKGVKALKHASHKNEYRKDHAKAGAVVNTPPAPARK